MLDHLYNLYVIDLYLVMTDPYLIAQNHLLSQISLHDKFLF
jgi:hypothetical protein